MEKINIGTVACRHDMPVQEYVFSKITYPNNFKWLEEYAYNYLKNKVNITGTSKPQRRPMSYVDPASTMWLESDVELNIYTTGLSQALIAIINAARRLHIHDIVIWHYDTDTNEYKPQRMVY